MGLGIVFRSMEPGQYLRLLQGISILWMRREKSQSSRKRWTDHLGDLPTFRKPFEKASSPSSKGGGVGDLSKSQSLWHFSPFKTTSSQRPRRPRRSFSFFFFDSSCCCCSLRKRREEAVCWGETSLLHHWEKLCLSLSFASARQVQAFKVYLDSHHCRWSILESQWLTFALCYSSRLPI